VTLETLLPGGLSIAGRFLRKATSRHEWYDDLPDPEAAIHLLRSIQRRPDLFSFIQRPPDVQPRYSYPMVMDHVAAVTITSFDHWWNHLVIKKIRKNVRRSEKYGVQVRSVAFDDDLVRGILGIYREVPMRSGRPFRHYNDDLDICRRKHATFLERSDFIGAYLEGRLIGFIKLVRAGQTARTMQFISMDRHRDLSPANALLAHAVRLCAERGIPHLVYGKLEYGRRGNAGLEEFKRANGFRKLEFPRYYVPLTALGSLAVRTGLQEGIIDLLPKGFIEFTRNLRTRWYRRRLGLTDAPQPEASPSSEPATQRAADDE
jgi:hypothetical protein